MIILSLQINVPINTIMKTLSLSGSTRENVGKRGASELRRQERVPAVLYGGEKQIHFSLSNNDAKKLIITPDVYVVELEIEGKKTKVIVQEVQLHPVTDKPVHMDFLKFLMLSHLKSSSGPS